MKRQALAAAVLLVLLHQLGLAESPKLAAHSPLYVLLDGQGNVGIGYRADPVAGAPQPLRACTKAEAGNAKPGTIRVFVVATGSIDYAGCPEGDVPSVECDGGAPAPVITNPPGGIYYHPGLASTGRLDLGVSNPDPVKNVCRVARP